MCVCVYSLSLESGCTCCEQLKLFSAKLARLSDSGPEGDVFQRRAFGGEGRVVPWLAASLKVVSWRRWGFWAWLPTAPQRTKQEQLEMQLLLARDLVNICQANGNTETNGLKCSRTWGRQHICCLLQMLRCFWFGSVCVCWSGV